MYTSGTTGKPKVRIVICEACMTPPMSLLLNVSACGLALARPQGAMMDDSRWNRFVTKPYLMPEPSVELSHGPLAHVQERQNFYIIACVGGRIAFFDQVLLPRPSLVTVYCMHIALSVLTCACWNTHHQDMSQLLSEAQLVRPTLFSAVPRVWNFLHSGAHKSALYCQQPRLNTRSLN
jgi:hypothetical protein